MEELGSEPLEPKGKLFLSKCWIGWSPGLDFLRCLFLDVYRSVGTEVAVKVSIPHCLPLM